MGLNSSVADWEDFNLIKFEDHGINSWGSDEHSCYIFNFIFQFYLFHTENQLILQKMLKSFNFVHNFKLINVKPYLEKVQDAVI